MPDLGIIGPAFGVGLLKGLQQQRSVEEANRQNWYERQILRAKLGLPVQQQPPEQPGLASLRQVPILGGLLPPAPEVPAGDLELAQAAGDFLSQQEDLQRQQAQADIELRKAQTEQARRAKTPSSLMGLAVQELAQGNVQAFDRLFDKAVEFEKAKRQGTDLAEMARLAMDQARLVLSQARFQREGTRQEQTEINRAFEELGQLIKVVNDPDAPEGQKKQAVQAYNMRASLLPGWPTVEYQGPGVAPKMAAPAAVGGALAGAVAGLRVARGMRLPGKLGAAAAGAALLAPLAYKLYTSAIGGDKSQLTVNPPPLPPPSTLSAHGRGLPGASKPLNYEQMSVDELDRRMRAGDTEAAQEIVRRASAAGQ